MSLIQCRNKPSSYSVLIIIKDDRTVTKFYSAFVLVAIYNPGTNTVQYTF